MHEDALLKNFKDCQLVCCIMQENKQVSRMLKLFAILEWNINEYSEIDEQTNFQIKRFDSVPYIILRALKNDVLKRIENNFFAKYN